MSVSTQPSEHVAGGSPGPTNRPDGQHGYAFNRTRQTFLATRLRIANTHLSRLRGLLGTTRKNFDFGQGLLIVPCHGVHTLAMGYPIDVIYLDERHTVLHVEENVKPWRFAPMRMDAASVLEVPCHTVWDTQTAVGDQIEIRVGAASSTFRG